MNDEQMISFGDAVKATTQEDGSVKLGGYLIRFSDETRPDLTGDFFTANTDFGAAEKSDGWFNHRMPVKYNGKRVTYKDQLPDVKLTKDNIGIFAEIVIGARSEYEKQIAELGIKGMLGWSSGTAPHLVDRKQVGEAQEITRWKLGLDASLTPTPAEPRSTNKVMSIKSFLEADDPAQETTMPENTIDVKSEVAEAVKSALAVRDAEMKSEADKQAAIKSAEDAGYQKAIAELKDRKAPAFNTKTELGFSEEKDAVPAFKHWLGTGQVNGGLITPDSSFNIKAAYNQTTGASGGYLVPDPLYNQIIAKRSNASWIRQLPVQMFSTDADHLLVPIEDTSQTAFALTAESGTYSNNEGTVAQKDLILYKFTKEVRATEEFLSNQATNFDSWLVNTLARAEALTENTIFTTGTGSGQPLGVAATGGSTAGNTTATTDIILPSELTAFAGYLGSGYNVPSECGFLMSNATKWYLRGLTSSAGAFVWGNTPGGDMQADNLMGYKVVVNDVLDPYTTASAKMIIFGNWNYYGVVEKPGMMVQRNPYLYMATGQVGIFANIYRGGATLQAEAIYHMINHS